MRTISTPHAPAPAGHYSQAVVHNGVVYVAGQLAKDPENPDAPPGGMGEQTRTVFANISKILEAAGSGLDRVLQATIFVSDLSQWAMVNEAFAEAFGEHRPARAVIPVGDLPRGRLVEVTVTAAVEEGS